MNREFDDWVGRRFGRWVVDSYAGRGYGNRHTWNCTCDCGTKRAVHGPNLLHGRSLSCGCLAREMTAAASTTHGATVGRVKISEYIIYMKIKGRCFNPTDAAYWMYGKRGITLCNGWKSFPQFYKDMGSRPGKLSIDRINNDIGYTCGKCEQCIKNGWPMNCRWATAKQQCNNRRSSRRITIGNVTKGMSEWAECWGISPQLVWSRLANGVTPEQLYARYARETRDTKTT